MDQWYGLLECEQNDNPLAMALSAETGHMAAKKTGDIPKGNCFNGNMMMINQQNCQTTWASLLR